MKQTITKLKVVAHVQNEGHPEPEVVTLLIHPTQLGKASLDKLLESALPEIANRG